MHSCPFLERGRFNFSIFFPSTCISMLWVHNHINTHKLQSFVCHVDRLITGIWWAYVSAGRDPAAATWAHSAPSVSTQRALFSGLNEGRSVHRHLSQHCMVLQFKKKKKNQTKIFVVAWSSCKTKWLVTCWRNQINIYVIVKILRIMKQ